MKPGFPAAAHEALGNEQLRRNLWVATHTIREKRAAVVAERTDWEELREAGRALKRRVLRHLDDPAVPGSAAAPYLDPRDLTAHLRLVEAERMAESVERPAA